MNPSNDFSLETALAQWRASMAASPGISPAALAELESHLRDAIVARIEQGETPAHAFAAAARELGDSEMLGREFQRARPNWPQWIAARFTRARLAKLARKVAAAVVIALFVKQFLVTSMYAASNGLAPEVPQGSHFLVWRLSSDFRPGDVVVYDDAGRNFLGRVVAVEENHVKVNRTGQPEETISRHRMIGRVIVTTR